MAGTEIHYYWIETAQKFIWVLKKSAACHLMLNGKKEFDEARINKFSK